MRNDLHFTTGRNETETPPAFFQWVEETLAGRPFVADMAATQGNAKVLNYYGPDHVDPRRQDCLAVDWPLDGPLWLNPPYGKSENACKRPHERCKKLRCAKRGWHAEAYIPGCYDFVEKAAKERARGADIWLLLAARTDTAWFHDFIWDEERAYWRPGVTGRFLQDRIKFIRAAGADDWGAPFPSLLVHFVP